MCLSHTTGYSGIPKEFCLCVFNGSIYFYRNSEASRFGWLSSGSLCSPSASFIRHSRMRTYVLGPLLYPALHCSPSFQFYHQFWILKISPNSFDKRREIKNTCGTVDEPGFILRAPWILRPADNLGDPGLFPGCFNPHGNILSFCSKPVKKYEYWGIEGWGGLATNTERKQHS